MDTFRKLGVMIDCSRNAVMNRPAFCRMVDILSALGYNTIRLYMEDTYEVEGEPYFGYLRGRYSAAELREMDAYAAEHGMELIPCIQTLAHLSTIFRYEQYSPIRDIDDILLVGDERTYRLIDRMFRSLANSFTSRRVNIGMDEAFCLGRGKYFTLHGAEKSESIMNKHLEKVLEIAEKYGFTCEMWGDMFMRAAYGEVYEHAFDRAEEVRMKIPRNVRLICWDYYHTEEDYFRDEIERYRKLSDQITFAGGAWTWLGFCPNNSYSIREVEAAVRACRAKGIEDVYFTMWGDNGGECSPFGVLPTLVCAAEFAQGNFDLTSIKEKFRSVVGVDFDLFSALEYPDKIYSGEKPDCCDPSKVILFTDPFMGIYDNCVRKDTAKAYYERTAEILRAGEESADWGYLFRPIRALCEVLAVKFELGVLTRDSYRARDKNALSALAEGEYALLLERLEAFYEAYERFWMTEKKPHGFDVQDARIGGLIRRVKHCRNRLLSYAKGEIREIPELEEEILNPFGMEKVDGIAYNYYNVLYTVNPT